MSLVQVDRLHTRLRSATRLPTARVQAWLDMFAAQDLTGLPGSGRDDAWLLLRRLPLRLNWDEDSADAEVGAQWSRALQSALVTALQEARTGTGADLLHYAHRHDALADLLYRSALGDSRRQWAWARMGLLPADAGAAPLPPLQALRTGVAQLLRAPGAAADVWPVLARLLAAEPDCAALGAVLRALPATDWTALLRASRRTSPYLPPGDAAARAAAPAPTRPATTMPPLDAAATALRDWAHARPALRASHADVLAALLATLAWPGPPPALGEGARRRDAALHALTAAGPVPHGPAPRGAGMLAPDPLSDADMRPATARTEAPPEGLITADDPAPPPLPQPAGLWLDTAWAGALFWLAQLPRSDLLATPGAPMPAVPAGLLRALVRALGVPDDDPVADVFCAGAAAPQAAPSPDHEERATAQVQRWSDWLDDAAPDLPPPRLQTVSRRPGRLHLRPGWVELQLPLAGVHTAIRRLGLDLDPGWLPWWGSALLIRYDD